MIARPDRIRVDRSRSARGILVAAVGIDKINAPARTDLRHAR